MSWRFIDWIWRIRGSVLLAPGQSRDDAFDRLVPLFHETGTTHDRAADRLTFRKKDQAAQDKMSVFDSGMLTVESGPAGPVLRYDLMSRALLFCFLAPFLFLAVAGITIGMGKMQTPPTAAEKAADEKKEAEKEKRDLAIPMNPIDKALGAPQPEKKKDKKDKKQDDEEDEGKPSPTPSYVFAGIFAALYVIGRVLEDRLAKRLFRKRLMEN